MCSSRYTFSTTSPLLRKSLRLSLWCFSGEVWAMRSVKIAENKVYLTRKYLYLKGKTACLSSFLKERKTFRFLQQETEVQNKNFQDEGGGTGPRGWITLTSKGGPWGSRSHMNGCTHIPIGRKTLRPFYLSFLQNKGSDWWSQPLSHTQCHVKLSHPGENEESKCSVYRRNITVQNTCKYYHGPRKQFTAKRCLFRFQLSEPPGGTRDNGWKLKRVDLD